MPGCGPRIGHNDRGAAAWFADAVALVWEVRALRPPARKASSRDEKKRARRERRAPRGEIRRIYGKRPRAALASATRWMPSVSAARRRLNLNFRFWYSTDSFALSRIPKSFVSTSSRLQ